jgi:rhodanese-related sulfurtransferase
MSAIAGAELIELGYCRIYDMPVGMVGWEAEGYPLDP